MIGPVLSASARSHQWRVALALLGIPMTSPPGEIAFNSVVTQRKLVIFGLTGCD